jgi:hypothetical protein
MKFPRSILSSLLLISVGAVTGVWLTHAQTPSPPPVAPIGDVMTYQGKLLDARGKSVTGNHTATFTIYENGKPVFEQRLPIVVKDGTFTCVLGGAVQLPTFDPNHAYEVRLKVGNFPEVRQTLTSVPMALNVRHAQRAHAASILAPPVKNGSVIFIQDNAEGDIIISAAGNHEIQVEGTLLPMPEENARFPNEGWQLGSWHYRWHTGWFNRTSNVWSTLSKDRLPIEDGQYGRGDVLTLGKEGLVKSTTPNDPLVQGVYDDAAREAVTFGIYDINVLGPIKRGDFLVSSSEPGHAQADKDPPRGAIIAQSLENFNGKQGRIKAMIRKM